MKYDFRDKVVVVAGASAEVGSGWCCAEHFAKLGARVIVAARSMHGLQRLAGQIGGRAIRCDISDETQVAALADAAREWGGADIAFNGAGQPVPSAFGLFDRPALDSAMAINFYGNLFFLREMARAMPNGGSITLMASVAAVRVTPGNLLYGCAKAATITAAQYAALEFAPRKIRVNVLVPGLIDTPMIAPLKDSPEIMEVYLKETPLKRIVDAAEIAETVQWLASVPSVTGTTITIDGGICLRRPPQPEELPTSAYDSLRG